MIALICVWSYGVIFVKFLIIHVMNHVPRACMRTEKVSQPRDENQICTLPGMDFAENADNTITESNYGARIGR